MAKNLVRIGVILLVFAAQWVWTSSPLLLFEVALLINLYVAPRESYIILVGTGILLDLFHWRVAGLPVTITLLVVLKLCEEVLARRHSSDISWQSLLACTVSAAGLLLLARFFVVPFVPWILNVLWTLIGASVLLFVLLIPAQRVGKWYRKNVLSV